MELGLIALLSLLFGGFAISADNDDHHVEPDPDPDDEGPVSL